MTTGTSLLSFVARCLVRYLQSNPALFASPCLAQRWRAKESGSR